MASKTKAHVKRLFKLVTNPDTGEEALSSDVFVDVRRYDKLAIKFQSTDEEKLAQEIIYVFTWNDDKNNPKDRVDASKAEKLQFENANAKRKTKKLVIRDPDVKKADDDGDLHVWLVEKVKVYMPRGEEHERQNQLVQFVFNNKPKDESDGDPSKTRKTATIKIAHNDLGGMKMKVDDEESGIRSRIVDWETYKEALKAGKEDEKDPLFLTVEFTDSFIVRFQPEERGVEGQRIKHVLQNKVIYEELFIAGDDGAKDADGETALIRLDPLQSIVNVGSNIIAVEFLPGKE